MTTIKHPLYKDFIDKGIISVLSHNDFKAVYENINDPFGKEALTIIYYTGCRPVQILNYDPSNPNKSFTTDNITKEGNYLKILIPPAKNGLPFTFYLPFSKFGITNLWNTCQKLPPNTPLFNKFSQQYVRKKINKKGIEKYYVEKSDKFRYYFKKWFSTIQNNPVPPYYLRHSRFSSMSQNGATSEDIMYAKGSKTLDSVRPYLHMSKDKARKINKFIK